MKRTEFGYDLPQELIAQTPAEPRDAARMLVLDRQSGHYEDRVFRELDEYLRPGDLLVLNDTKVLPARIYGVKEGTGAHVEFLLLTPKGNDVWEVLAGPGKRAKPGSRFIFGDGLMQAEILDVVEGGNRLAKLSYDGNFYNVLEKIGEMPLPPYITQKLEDQSQYQTIYARENGSAAAPTAGLHFTDELFERLAQKGVSKAFVTLHVGLGTFRPVKEENIEDHLMHSEHYYMPADTARMINETKANGGRVIAVGTTSCRTLESVATFNGKIEEAEGWTDIFIYPGYEFKCMDGLITNFHLPESTLIMLVSAFCGYDNTMAAYRHAVEERYRFFSFGDAMLIL